MTLHNTLIIALLEQTVTLTVSNVKISQNAKLVILDTISPQWRKNVHLVIHHAPHAQALKFVLNVPADISWLHPEAPQSAPLAELQEAPTKRVKQMLVRDR